MTAWAADSIYVNGKVVTVDGRDSIAQALAVKGDRLLAVGTDAEVREWAGAGTEVIDLAGFVYFIDRDDLRRYAQTHEKLLHALD